MRRRKNENTRRRKGFALVAVLWGLGLISLLITSFMSNGRLRLQTAFNVANATKAQLIAEGAIDAAIAALLSERGARLMQTEGPRYDGKPDFCAFFDAAVAISIEDEGGKVDLNSAQPELLQKMMMGFGVEMRQADALANAIVAFRSKPASGVAPPEAGADKPFPPKHTLFQSVLELDQVAGVDAPIFRTLAPFLTVYTHRQGLDARSAPPALFAALAGYSADDVQVLATTPFPNGIDRSDPRFPQRLSQTSEHGAFLVHVEALLPSGQVSVREAVVDLHASSAGPYAVKELRRGASRFAEELRSLMKAGAAALSSC